MSSAERDHRRRGKPQQARPRQPPESREPPEPPNHAALHDAALRYLARFQASRSMVERVLARKMQPALRAGSIDREQVAVALARALDRLTASGLLDDRAFAEAKSHSLQRRGFGTRSIAANLAAKGIARDHTLAVLAAADDDGAALRAALALARRRRIGPYRETGPDAASDPDETAKQRRRELGVLLRAGHDMALARRIVAASDAGTLEAESAEAPD